MKPTTFALAGLAVILSVSCNKEKAAIEETKDATIEAINVRKAEVDADAKFAQEQTDINARIDKSNIEANKDFIQAELDADKKKAEAVAKAAKTRIDAENP